MKLGGWVVMLTAMMIFLAFVGLGSTAMTDTLQTFGLNISSSTAQLQSMDVESSSFWSYLFGSIAGILTLLSLSAAVTIGLYVKTGDTNILILPIIITIGGYFIGTFWQVIKIVTDFNQWWMTSIIVVIFGALSIGFITSCLDYFVGR